jgi:hypothetical protein
MKVQGTTATTTEVQRTADAEATILHAADAQLIANFKAAAAKASASAKALAGDVVALAHTVEALHTAQTWSRQIDPTTGKPFTSARSYYEHLFESGESPLASPDRTLQTVLRRELVQCLIDPDNLELILGSNELAALVGVDKGTISRDKDKVAPAIEAAKEAADAEAAAEALQAALDEAAADAAAKALEDGKDEAAAAYAGEVARATLKATADKEAKEAADAEAKEAADKEAKAETAATQRVAASFTRATDGVVDRLHLLTPAQRATAREAAADVIAKIDKLEAMIAKASADVEVKAKAAAAAAAKAAATKAAPKPGAPRRAAATG